MMYAVIEDMRILIVVLTTTMRILLPNIPMMLMPLTESLSASDQLPKSQTFGIAQTSPKNSLFVLNEL